MCIVSMMCIVSKHHTPLHTQTHTPTHTHRGKGPFEIMKLDIQGAELMALVGASETMKGAQVVLLEVCYYMDILYGYIILYHIYIVS
jgi:hypothetical protein